MQTSASAPDLGRADDTGVHGNSETAGLLSPGISVEFHGDGRPQLLSHM